MHYHDKKWRRHWEQMPFRHGTRFAPRIQARAGVHSVGITQEVQGNKKPLGRSPAQEGATEAGRHEVKPDRQPNQELLAPTTSARGLPSFGEALGDIRPLARTANRAEDRPLFRAMPVTVSAPRRLRCIRGIRGAATACRGGLPRSPSGPSPGVRPALALPRRRRPSSRTRRGAARRSTV